MKKDFAKDLFLCFFGSTIKYEEGLSIAYALGLIAFFAVIFILILQTKYLIQFFKAFCTKLPQFHKEPVTTEITASHIIRERELRCKIQMLLDKTSRHETNFTDAEDDKISQSLSELLEMDMSTDTALTDAEWIFNNGRFRTEKELDEYEQALQQREYFLTDFDKDVFNTTMYHSKQIMLNTSLLYTFMISNPFILIIAVIKRLWDYFHTDISLFAAIAPVNFLYILIFTVSFIVNYFVFNGLSLRNEYICYNQITQYNNLAGLKNKLNKHFLADIGLYTVSSIVLLKSLKKIK